jgi:hypothetical protein
MKEFCENEFCENPGAKVVAVSVDKPADQERTLCAACEEAFTWGVQHGTMTTREGLDWQDVQSFLLGGFIVLTRNVTALNRDEQFEAWAYLGVLNFETATPMTFGLGTSPSEALSAVNHQIKVHTKGAEARPTMPLCVDRRELATILAALRFHQDENLQCGQNIPDVAISEIATDGGLIKPLDFEEVSELCERLNVKRGVRVRKGLFIEPPPKEEGDEPLRRVVYAIDVHGPKPLDAARTAHRLMVDPQSLPPVLDVMDARGKVVSIDLSKEAPA